jgi:hypothetical protein
VGSISWLSGCSDTGALGRVPDASPDGPAFSVETGAPRDAGMRSLVDASDGGSAERDAVVDASAGFPSREASVPAEPDGGSLPASDSGCSSPTCRLPAEDASAADAGAFFAHVPGWSVRKRVLTSGGGHAVLEEVLTSFAEAEPGATRIQSLGSDGAVEHSFTAPSGSYVSDFCRHPSGEFSVVLVAAADRSVSLVRLDAGLLPLGAGPIHDPEVSHDIDVDGGPSDLFVNGFALDAARVARVGEDVLVVVYSSFYSVIAYRMTFSGGWSAPLRTLVEPPRPLTPFLPTSGSFDTFGALVAWFRVMVDTDEDGNAFIAIWANPLKVRAHVAAFRDGLAPLHSEPSHASDADVLLTRLNRDGTRAWSRVVGTENEDEPYAVRASNGRVVVVGRSRRAPGFDNTFWDAFVSVSTSAGVLSGSRALAFDASSIFLSADALPGQAWALAGSDGWSQNPDGLSVLTFGAKLLVELPSVDAAPLRRALPPGPRHNELRSVVAAGGRLWYGGHEDGPIMHTGDEDPSLIHATGVLGSVAE